MRCSGVPAGAPAPRRRVPAVSWGRQRTLNYYIFTACVGACLVALGRQLARDIHTTLVGFLAKPQNHGGLVFGNPSRLKLPWMFTYDTAAGTK